MTPSPELDHNSRLLVIAPHPDDETLATGGLIQMALAAGAKVRVILATDGDNNPWPQRWIEKRWRIDAAARARWGARRRVEAATALARLGVAAEDVCCLGWPDQGLTALLMRGSEGIDRLAAEVLDFAPTVIASPSLADLHPDHNALGVMLDIVLAGSRHADCQRLTYVVHGDFPECRELRVPQSEAHSQGKRLALQAHQSQLVLSASRMARLCERSEWFQPIQPDKADDPDGSQLDWEFPPPRSRLGTRRHALLLIVRTDSGVHRQEIPLADLAGATPVEVQTVDAKSLQLQVQPMDGGFRLSLPCEGLAVRAYAKIEKLGHRVLIYDRQGWEMRKTG